MTPEPSVCVASPLASLVEAAEHVLHKYEPEKREGCWELQELERVVQASAGARRDERGALLVDVRGVTWSDVELLKFSLSRLVKTVEAGWVKTPPDAPDIVGDLTGQDAASFAAFVASGRDREREMFARLAQKLEAASVEFKAAEAAAREGAVNSVKGV